MTPNCPEIVSECGGRHFGPDLPALNLGIPLPARTLGSACVWSVPIRRSDFLRHCERMSHVIVPEEKNSVRHPRRPGRRTAPMPRERQQLGKEQFLGRV